MHTFHFNTGIRSSAYSHTGIRAGSAEYPETRRLPARDVREEVTTEVTTGLRCNGRTVERSRSKPQGRMRSKIHSRAVPLRPSLRRQVPGSDWSERGDSNSRPLAPEASALPGCATLRPTSRRWEKCGQIPPKKRTIGPGRSNLRPHRRLPASPKLWAILQPGCNHYPAFERFTSGHGSRAHLAQARLSVCNGPDPDVQVVRRLLNRSLLGQLHAARPPAAPSRRGEG